MLNSVSKDPPTNSAKIGVYALSDEPIQFWIIRNRQDTLEAVQIAASGKVKCSYTIRGLSELPEFVFSCMFRLSINNSHTNNQGVR